MFDIAQPSEQTSSGKFFRQTSNEGRAGSSSSSSLEALSRRGSNPDTMETTGAGGSGENSISEMTNKMLINSELTGKTQARSQTCVCLCSGWAEILIRRPTGNMSWMMRIQNQMSLDAQNSEISLQNLMSQMMPSLGAIYPNSESWTLEPSRNHTSKASSLTEISQIKGDNSGSSSSITTTTTRSTAESTTTKTVVQADDFQPNFNFQESTVNHQEPTLNSQTVATSSDIANSRLDTRSTSTSHRMTPELIPSAFTAVTSDDKTTANLLSGPIDIPKSTHTYKIPSGSFSDIEPELDDEESADVAFEENDSRSRNPVRRVNSSPEMSSNYRHPFVAQKASTSTQPSANVSGANIANIHVTSSEDDTMVSGTNTADAEQQQKKKNFSKERVNCEAIPEEITDSTPPNQQPLTVERQHSNEEKIKSNRSTSNACVSLPASRGPSTDTLLPNASQSNLLPRKQHSADDALQQRSDQTGDGTSIAASAASSSTRSLSTTTSGSIQQQRYR